MNESIDYLHEVFDAFGPICALRMFGDWGIYHDGLMFVLYAVGRSTDLDNLALLRRQGLSHLPTYNATRL